MKIAHIVGIDVSKLTLDCHHHQSQLPGLSIGNNINGFRELLRWLKKTVSKDIENIMLVMEHTGYYAYDVEVFLFKHNISYTKKPALDIKRSCGMIRGKVIKLMQK